MSVFRSALAQMLATLMATVGIVLVITFTVVLFVPTPEIRPVSLRQIADALAAPDTARSQGLRYRVRQNAPDLDEGSNLERQHLFEIILSNLLDHPRDEIIVVGRPSEVFTQVTVAAGSLEGVQPTLKPDEQQSDLVVRAPIMVEGDDAKTLQEMVGRFLQAEPGIDGVDAEPGRVDPLFSLLTDIELSTLLTAAVKRSDGNWRTVTRSGPVLTGWRMQVLLAFVLSAVVLIPMGWFAARQLSAPLRNLARLADDSQLDKPLSADGLSGSQELRSAAAALQNMHKRLSEEAGKRSRLVAALAHDLRTPLTGLRVRIETAVSETQRDKMADDIARMEAMIQEMMTYARGGDARSAEVELDLNEVLIQVVDEMALNAPITFRVPDTPVKILGDRLALRRAVANLIDNAQIYGSDTQVELSTDAAQAVVTVSNTARPFCDGDLTRLLAPFERGEKSRSRNTGGTGLGLAIASDIARHHGGALRLENRPPDRVAAILTLPTL